MQTKQSKKTSVRKKNFLTVVEKNIQKDLNRIYKRNQVILGWPKGKLRMFDKYARKNSVAIVGAALGDEGKGRLIDNAINTLLHKKGIKGIYIIRFQGGNNAGHTVERENITMALHVVPSGIFYSKAISIMDRGMIIHPEDLQVEINYVEDAVGSMQDRIFLSDDAILCTDLERAEEQLNGVKEGKSKGGTGRGIGPAYAHHYDKTGLRIADLMEENWQEKLENRYDRYTKEFDAYNLKLAEINVPDFYTIKKKKIPAVRMVGDKKIFIDRLRKVRSWLIRRNIVTNTFLLHQKIANDPDIALVIEGAQATGLDSWIGTRPDVTSSNTSAFGIREGTAFWRPYDIANRIGVIKIPYTSSVGVRRMPTHVDLPKDLADLPADASEDQKWAAFIRKTAHEYGTTTGRPRDINKLDLAFLTYNARMAGIETLAVTHADLSRETDKIKVCTHYTDHQGNYIPYQPGLRFITNYVPQYITLPGWDGEACRKAKKMKDLPVNCLKFMAFIQARTGFPVVAATTGPERNSLVTFPGYLV